MAHVGELGFIAVAAPALAAAAVDRLPRGELGVTELDEDPFWRLVAAFLIECRRAQTRPAYFTDLSRRAEGGTTHRTALTVAYTESR